MGAVDLLGVEPDVALIGHLGGELVVLAVVLAHGDPQPGTGAELHGLARHPLLPLGGGLGPAEIAGIGELLADLPQISLPLRQADVFQHAVQILQLTLALLDLDGEHLLRLFGLVVVLIILGGVLLRGEQRVQLDVDLAIVRVIEVLGMEHRHPLLHPVEIGGDDVPLFPQLLTVKGSGQLLLLVGQLAGGAVPCVGHCLHQILPPLFDPFRRLPALIEAVQQNGKAVLTDALGLRPVLEDGQEGEIHRLTLPDQQICCKVILLYNILQLEQLLNQALLPSGPEHDFPGNQG